MSYLSGDIQDDPDLDLDEVFNRVFDLYPHEFRQYWGLDDDHAPDGHDPDTWERYCELDRLANRIAAIAAALVRPAKLREEHLRAPISMREAATRSREKLRKLIERVIAEYPEEKELQQAVRALRIAEEDEYEFFIACLQLYLVEFLVWPESLAERTVKLTMYVARVRNHRAIQYLARVSRCYLYDMRAELAVMARAVLEAVLEDTLPEDQVRQIRRIPRRMRVGLSDYLAVADGTVLRGGAVSSARKLKQFGDDAIHVSAEVVSDPDEVLDHLATVLRSFERLSDAPRSDTAHGA